LLILQAVQLPPDEFQRRHNNTYKYILLGNSVFSRYLYGVPLRSKRGDEVARALEFIFEQDSYRKNHTDRGSEFINPHVKKGFIET